MDESTDKLNSAKQRGRRRWRVVLVGVGIVVLLFMFAVFLCWRTMISMPGESHRGPLSQLDESQTALSKSLRRDVEQLAEEIGERNLEHYPNLLRAADFIEEQLNAADCDVSRNEYTVRDLNCYNIAGERRGTSKADEIVIVGAHYDSVYLGSEDSPGANDNASGVAAMLALARYFADKKTERTLRFVAFANEEPPYFQTEDMGSLVYTRGCHQRSDNIVAVLSLETIGYYDDQPGSQQYPPPLGTMYPSEGNFIAVVGNVGSRRLVRRVVESFRRHAQFPSEGGAVPGEMTGVGWSDHWSFWQEGYEAVMITDTAPFRYPYYHTAQDTPDKLNYDHMARVVDGLCGVVEDLAGIN